jgi:hypothetical protein
MPNKPMAVVAIKIIGPTSAKELLRMSAFPTSLNFKKRIATVISIIPEKNRNKDMPRIALSNKWNKKIASALKHLFCHYMREKRK